jgi:hypothetical protein
MERFLRVASLALGLLFAVADILLAQSAVRLTQAQADDLKVRTTKAELLPGRANLTSTAEYAGVTTPATFSIHARGWMRVEKVHIHQGDEVDKDQRVVTLHRLAGDPGIISTIEQKREALTKELGEAKKLAAHAAEDMKRLEKLGSPTQEYLLSLRREQAKATALFARDRVEGLRSKLTALDSEYKDVKESGVEAQDLLAPRRSTVQRVSPADAILQPGEVVAEFKSKTWLRVEGVVPLEAGQQNQLNLLLSYGEVKAQVEVDGQAPFEAVVRKKAGAVIGGIPVVGFINHRGELKEGSRVRVIVPLVPPTVQVPTEAIVESQRMTFVVVWDGNVYALRPIEVIRRGEKVSHVRSVLSPRDASSGFPLIRPGSEVVSEHAIDLVRIIEDQ